MDQREINKVALLLQDAKQGVARAQRLLAFRYLQGRGVAQDAHLAFFWMQQAAAQQFSLALRSLGEFYEQGVATEANLIEACKLYSAAAIKGDPIAAAHLIRLQKL